jgi:hypothetical protein
VFREQVLKVSVWAFYGHEIEAKLMERKILHDKEFGTWELLLLLLL